MKFRTIVLIGCGLMFVAGTAAATSIPVDQARTYCNTDPLSRRIAAAYVDVGGTVGTPLTDDSDVVARGNEIVWQVIGNLGTPDEGQAYCGFLGLPGGFSFSGSDVARGLEDCVGVIRFAIGASSFKSAAISMAGAGNNLGVNQGLSVVPCTYGEAGNVADGESAPGPNPDCIIDDDDFVGGSFVGIHDILRRKADNNVGLVGGVSDINFAAVSTSRMIQLNAAGVAHINANVNGHATFIMRCSDSDGNSNGFLGSGSNAMVLHDPAGLGFLGAFATISLETVP
jgi:hypothetical protein